MRVVSSKCVFVELEELCCFAAKSLYFLIIIVFLAGNWFYQADCFASNFH